MDKSSSIFSFDRVPRGIVWAIGWFLLAEVACRLLWTPGVVGQRLFTRFEPTFNYGYGDHHPTWFEEGDRAVFYPSQYLNYRKQTLPLRKAPEERRVFVFGGSVSRGGEDDNYPLVLEKLLHREHPDIRWNVVNFSADGVGSARMLLLLENTMSFLPDLVILHVHGSNEFEDERDYEYRNTVNSGINQLLYQSWFIVLSKKIYSYVSSSSLSAEVRNNDEVVASRDPNNRKRWNETMAANLAAMLDMCRRKEIPSILIGRAERNLDGAGYETELVRAINAILQKHIGEGETYFDTPAALLGKHPATTDKALIFADETHWTGKGHRAVAESLVDIVIRRVLIFH